MKLISILLIFLLLGSVYPQISDQDTTVTVSQDTSVALSDLEIRKLRYREVMAEEVQAKSSMKAVFLLNGMLCVLVVGVGVIFMVERDETW